MNAQERYYPKHYPHVVNAIMTLNRPLKSFSGNSFEHPHTSLGQRSPDPLASAYRKYRGGIGNNKLISKNKKKTRKDRRQAGHTRTSALRLDGDRHGWRLPETEEFVNRQIDKSLQEYQDIMIAKNARKQKPVKKKPPTNSLDIPNAIWLKTHGLAARKLTLMDILTPTVVKMKPKYIPALNSNVMSKVFNDVPPIAHVSPRDRQNIRLVNPAAVDLFAYDERLKNAIEEYHQRLDLLVWKKLSDEEREKFENSPVSYMEHSDAFNQALDRLNRPISEKEIQLLVDEIILGERYLQQLQDLQQTVKIYATEMEKKNEEKEEEESSSSSSPPTSPTQPPWPTPFPPEATPLESTPAEPTPPCKFKGQRVIARDDVDGFYYSGVVIKHIDARHAQILFEYGEEKIVGTRFYIVRSGAVCNPPLSVGDRVLAYSNRDSNVSCYVPAIVIDAPRRAQGIDRFYTVLTFNNVKSCLQRHKLVKISETRYAFAVRYIMRAAQVNPYEPCVNFFPPPPEPDYVKELRSCLYEIIENFDDCKEDQKRMEKILKMILDTPKDKKVKPHVSVGSPTSKKSAVKSLDRTNTKKSLNLS